LSATPCRRLSDATGLACETLPGVAAHAAMIITANIDEISLTVYLTSASNDDSIPSVCS
jgi:hypothetical protein